MAIFKGKGRLGRARRSTIQLPHDSVAGETQHFHSREKDVGFRESTIHEGVFSIQIVLPYPLNPTYKSYKPLSISSKARAAASGPERSWPFNPN